MTVSGTTTNYTYNALDQLTSAGAVTYNYDARGNQIKITYGSNITNYAYNSADQLTNVTATGVKPPMRMMRMAGASNKLLVQPSPIT